MNRFSRLTMVVSLSEEMEVRVELRGSRINKGRKWSCSLSWTLKLS
jgi:hypothetical protein